MNNEIWIVHEDAGERIDVWVANQTRKSRSFVQGQIKSGNVLVHNKQIKANYVVQMGDQIQCYWNEELETTEPQPENIPLNIIYQDADIAVIDKQKGLVVHPAAGHAMGTLVNGLLYHLDATSTCGGVARAGIVHRIDKDTSGLLVVAKNNEAHEVLAEQMKTKQAGRIYVAISKGYIPEQGLRIDKPIGRSERDRKKMAIRSNGRYAVTNVKPIETYRGYSLLQCSLETGRTHQIRVHLASEGHSIVGDEVYGGKALGMTTQALHACELHIEHPCTKEKMIFTSEPPAEFIALVQKLRKEADLLGKNEELGW